MIQKPGYEKKGLQGHEQAKAALDRLKASASPSSDQLVGARVKLAGLQAKPEMNGATGLVTAFNEATGRYAVELDAGGPPVTLKGANMERL